MTRILHGLESLAKPWKAPSAILLAMLGINRLILAGAFPNHGKPVLSWGASLSRFGIEIITVFFLAGGLAVCLLLALKIFNRASNESQSFQELVRLGLRAQTPYLFAGPAAIVIIRAGQWFGAESWTRLSQFLNGGLIIATFFTLYTLLRQRFGHLSELSILALTFSPYLVLTGFIIAGLLSFFFLIAAIVAAIILS